MNDVEARMAALRRRFADSADQHSIALRAALKVDDRDRVSEIAHHLAGAAGIFGQPVLGNCGAQLEQAIDAGADGAALESFVDAVLAALDQMARSH